MMDGRYWSFAFGRAPKRREVSFGVMQRGNMAETGSRMTLPGKPPNESEIAEWIGEEAFRYWNHVMIFACKSTPQ